MKTKILGLAALLLFATQTPAQSTFTVEARNYDISDNLDLRAVASIFAESRDLSDFCAWWKHRAGICILWLFRQCWTDILIRMWLP